MLNYLQAAVKGMVNIMMLGKIIDFMELNQMVEKGDSIVIGVSGGADSICLLYVLSEISKEYSLGLRVVHVNHQLRGEEANEDQEFVRLTCEKLGVDFHSFSYDVKKISQSNKISEEEAGRKVRYQSFLEICLKYKCNKIATAHNKNDNAETFLFNLFRGSGIKGLSGIDSSLKLKRINKEVTIIRPLLCVTRREIEAFLHTRDIPYRIDSTNLTDNYSRNKIRNNVLTYATKEINNNTIEHISRAANHLKEIALFIEETTERSYKKVVSQREDGFLFNIEDILKENIVIQKAIVRKIFEQLGGRLKDVEAVHIQQVLELYDKPVGKRIDLPYGMVALKEYEAIKFYCESQIQKQVDYEATCIKIDGPGVYYLPGDNNYLEVNIFSAVKNITIPKNSCIKWFDYDKIEIAVEVRTRRTGDYIQINNSGGRKKLKDYFIDRKIPREKRSKTLLVADGNHIMWILGKGDRISEKYKISESTVRILSMRLINAEDNEDARKY